MAATHSEVIWTRQDKSEVHRKRWMLFGLIYGVPCSIALVSMALCAGLGEALGLGILLGGFGSMLAAWIALANLQQRQNGQLVLHANGELQWGKKRFDLKTVEAWTTRMDEFRAVTATPNHSESFGQASAEVVLRYPQPDWSEAGPQPERFRMIFWLGMTAAELEGVRACLAPHIAAPWVAPEKWRMN